MRETIQQVLLILLVSGTIFFTNLGNSRLWDRDEPRNAGCAQEMLERGDWIVPTFNDELRHQKPVLLYWLMMTAYSVFGVNEFSARFWSVVLAMGTVLLTYGIGRRVYGSRTGVIGAVALSSCLMFDVAARAATPDSILAFCSTAALFVFVMGCFKRQPNGALQNVEGWFPRNLAYVVPMFALMGVGVLAKGPVGVIMPMAIIGMFLMIQNANYISGGPANENRVQQWQGWASDFVRVVSPVSFCRQLIRMRPFLAASIVLLIAGPWYMLVDMKTNGVFTEMFFVGEHFGRATTAFENHEGGIWFYPVALLIGFFPWSVFWGPTLFWSWGGKAGKPYSAATRFLLCWIGVQVGLFTMAETKLPSYVTPCYPALALLTAGYIDSVSRNVSNVAKVWFYAAAGGLVFSGVLVLGGVGYAAVQYMPSQNWLALLGLIPIACGFTLFVLLRSHRKYYIPHVFSGAAVLFCWLLFGMGTVSIDHEQQSHLILTPVAKGQQAVASYGCLESSWVFYGGKPIHELTQDSECDDELTRDSYWQFKPKMSLEKFADNHPDGFLITTADQVDLIERRIPKHFVRVESAEYFLKNKELILLRGDRFSRETMPGSSDTAISDQLIREAMSAQPDVLK